MKANQFVKNENAVSPVIGVILMVAITVILSTIVFVLVSRLSNSNTQANAHLIVNNNSSGPRTLAFTVDEVSDSLQYTNLTIKSSTGALITYTTSAGTTLSAGDVITLTGLTTNTSYTFNFIYNGHLITSANGHTTN